MASERLSKLQKWILKRTYEHGSTSRAGAKGYFNKGIRDGLTNSERVTLHKSLKNLLQKELMKQGMYRSYILTEKGFDVLKVNDFPAGMKNISFKDYQEREEKHRQEYEKWRDTAKAVALAWSTGRVRRRRRVRA